jgi:hypothetical protein
MKKKTKTSIEEDIAKRLRANIPWAAIKNELHVGNTRISRVSDSLKSNSGIIPSPLSRGRPQKLNQDIVQYLEQQTIDHPSLGSGHLAKHILSSFGINFSHCTISAVRNMLHFRF